LRWVLGVRSCDHTFSAGFACRSLSRPLPPTLIELFGGGKPLEQEVIGERLGDERFLSDRFGQEFRLEIPKVQIEPLPPALGELFGDGDATRSRLPIVGTGIRWPSSPSTSTATTPRSAAGYAAKSYYLLNGLQGEPSVRECKT
jgi:hypothetical protein